MIGYYYWVSIFIVTILGLFFRKIKIIKIVKAFKNFLDLSELKTNMLGYKPTKYE